jgi:hypothetical protein
MPFPINYSKTTINYGGKITGSVFMFTGKNCPELGLPNGFIFQAPDKFAYPVEENINSSGQLKNTFPLTNGMNGLSYHLIEWIKNRIIE